MNAVALADALTAATAITRASAWPRSEGDRRCGKQYNPVKRCAIVRAALPVEQSPFY
jgi:hypothetical protein